MTTALQLGKTASAAPPRLDQEVVVSAARAMIPLLRESAGEAEERGEIQQETHQAFRDAGFYRLAQPVRYGGGGLDLDAVNDVCFELGRGDPSAAWVAGFYAVHNHTLGTYPQQAQEEYWANGAQPNMATGSAMVRGEFEDVPGGVYVSGEWDFCSGINHADYLQIYRFVDGQVHQLLLPRSDFSIIYNWRTAGARATASNRARIERAFVPRHRIGDVGPSAAGQSRGRALYGTRYYKLPYFTIGGRMVAYTILGGAQGLLDVFQKAALTRKETVTGEAFIARATNQVRLAESAVEIDAAWELLSADTRRLNAWADSEIEPSLEQRARVRRNSAYSIKCAVKAAGRLYDVAGAHAIYDVSSIQRYFRDVTAMAHTLPALWDPPAEQYGRIVWGLDPSPSML